MHSMLRALACLCLYSLAAAQQQSTAATPTKPAPHKGPDDRLTEAHGVLMAVSFVALIPISIIISSTRQRFLGASWFNVHQALGLIAAVLIIAGAILGIIAWTEITRVKRILLAHMVIGLILLAFVILQVVFALARPRPVSNIRKYWTPSHHTVGRLALLLGFADAIIGAYAAHMEYDWYVWICVVWGVIVLVGIPMVIIAKRSPQGQVTEDQTPATSTKGPSGTATSKTAAPASTAHDTPYV